MGRAEGTEADLTLEPLALEEVDAALSAGGLSEWFDPFLPGWCRETLRAGGQVIVGREADRLVGLLLTDPVDRTASVFSRSDRVAEELGLAVAGRAVYLPVDLGGPRETFAILRRPLDAASVPRLAHRVRLLAPAELAEAARLLREVYGGRPERWLTVAAAEGEQGFGVDLDGRLSGVAWAQVVGSSARFHTLTVRPWARRLGIGRALLAARLIYAERAGARSAVAEVSERNAASLALLRSASFEKQGELFLHPPPTGAFGLGTAIPTA